MKYFILKYKDVICEIDLEVPVIFYEELPWRPFEKGNTGIFNTENFYDNCILSNRKQF